MAEGSGVFAQTTLSICMEVRTISEAIAWYGDKRYVHAIVVKDSMCTIEKVHLGMYYADWKPANTASQPTLQASLRASYGFSPLGTLVS